MATDEAGPPEPAIGLCAACRHRRVQASRRGSVFYRCARADEDDDYPRYPPLPVLRCSGVEPEGSPVPDGQDGLSRD